MSENLKPIDEFVITYMKGFNDKRIEDPLTIEGQGKAIYAGIEAVVDSIRHSGPKLRAPNKLIGLVPIYLTDEMVERASNKLAELEARDCGHGKVNSCRIDLLKQDAESILKAALDQ